MVLAVFDSVIRIGKKVKVVYSC